MFAAHYNKGNFYKNPEVPMKDGKINILIADDEKEIRDILAYIY